MMTSGICALFCGKSKACRLETLLQGDDGSLMPASISSPALPIFIGCPVWNCEGWNDVVFPAGTKRPQWLSWYTQMFNCVEGNSSFYAIPTVNQVRRWASEAVPGFRFCLKFPREISHDRSLINAESPTRQFLLAIEELARGDRLGPTFLQLGPRFGADRLDVLTSYLTQLPREFPWAVELRHPSWYDVVSNEARLDELLTRLNIDKVIFDSRPLNQAPPDDDFEKQSQSRKPQTPLRKTAIGKHPLLRLIGRNRVELVDNYVTEWLPTICDWVAVGKIPYVFAHTPDDTFAPHMARRMWEQLRTSLPGTYGPLPMPPRKPRQLELLL
jgi:uncharacterized protein YecE (DUF72 family)